MRTWIVIGALAVASPAVAQPAAPATTTPPPELIAAAKAQTGTYRCKGHMVVEDRGTAVKKRPVSARLAIKLDLDGRWLVWRLKQDKTKLSKHPLGYIIYRSFDAAAGTWRAVQLDSTGGRAELTAADGATWTGTLVSRGTTVGIRDHQELANGVLRLWGEYEIDAGVFEPGYDVTCRR
jgi:hypothetical protein